MRHGTDSNDNIGTTMKSRIAAILLSTVMFASPMAHAVDKAAADAELQAMWKAVQADKKAYVASMLKLTPAEDKRFWPIYDAYQRDLQMYNRKRNVALEGLIGADKGVSDLYAKQLANELIAADEGEVKARRKMQGKLIQARLLSPIPAKKAALYLQIESRIRAVQNYVIAEEFDLIK